MGGGGQEGERRSGGCTWEKRFSSTDPPTDGGRRRRRAPILGLSMHTIPAVATLGSRSKLEGEGIPSFSSSKNPRLVIPFRVGKGEMARGDYIGGGEGSSNNNPFLFPADHKGKKPKFMQDIFRMNESGKTPQFEWKTWDQRGANYSREKKNPTVFLFAQLCIRVNRRSGM